MDCNVALTRRAITFAFCLFTFAFAVGACGGGNEPANTGPKAASLDGDRNDSAFQFEDAVDVKQAPTTTHGALAKLLPKSALDKNSVKYGGWDAVKCALSAEAPENAALPVVAAEYRSAGAKIVTDTESKCGSAEIEYPQKVTLIFIKAPEAIAAQPIADALTRMLDVKGFNELDDLFFTGGREDNEPIKRFGRVTPQEENDDVYVAYVKVIGDLVIYALESEVAPKLPGPGGAQMDRLNEGGRGTRVGAQLIALALTRRQAP